MTRPVFVHLLPRNVDASCTSGGTAIVIDVLRASTTICHALEAGAACVLPVGTIEEAREQRAGDADVLLGGERGGRPIDGFDIGNSPPDYGPEVVGDRRVVFTTTNGTRALLHCREADEIVVACFANLSAVVSRVSGSASPVHVVCAGTDGAVTLEDCLCAGAIVRALERACPECELANDSARLAAAAYDEATREEVAAGILAGLRASQGGRNLAGIGLEADIATCARVDTTAVVPVFDPTCGTITSAG